MKAIRVAVRAAGIAAMVAVVASGQMALVAADGELKAEAVADTNGNLHVPNAYRTTYEFLGTWAVAADQGQGSQELHVVYASPGTITAYRRDGHFPDGYHYQRDRTVMGRRSYPTRRASTCRGQRLILSPLCPLVS